MPAKRTSSDALPKIPHPGVSLLRRPNGTLFVRFRRGGRTKDRALEAQSPSLAYAEAVGLADRFERRAFDPWEERRSVPTVQEAADRWTTADPSLSASTVQKRREIVSLLVGHVGPDVRLDRVSSEALVGLLYGERRATATVKGYHARLSTLFSWCVGRRYLDASPMDDVPKPRPEKKPPRLMTEAQLEVLVARVESDRRTKRAGHGAKLTFHPADWLPSWLRLGYYTGLRPGEIRRLRWRDVDHERGLVRVRNSDSGKTKTGEERAVPIYGVTRDVLAACERRCRAMGEGLDPDGPVIPGARGGLMNAGQVAKWVRTFRREAGLPEHLVPYSTRHGYASTMIDKGVPARVVQERIGHADGRMTQNYIDLIAERHALEESVFSGPTSPETAATADRAPATSALHQLSGGGQTCPPEEADSGPARRPDRTKNAPGGVSRGVDRGAEHETRTRDLHHGKVALYQLS